MTSIRSKQVLHDEAETLFYGTSLPLSKLGTPTYTSLQQYIDATGSAGFFSGGTVTRIGGGAISVASGQGGIRVSNSGVANLVLFDWAANPSILLTDNAINYIYVDYNSGSPIVAATTNIAAPNQNTQFIIQTTYRNGSTVEIIPNSGVYLNNYRARSFERFSYSGIQRMTGAVVGMKLSGGDTRYLTTTDGIYYKGDAKVATPAQDTTGTDRITYYYYTGSAWATVTNQQVINNTQYNNIASGLATLTNSRYGVLWVYVCLEGNIYIVFGQGDYLSNDAQSAQPPKSLPPYISAWTTLAAKIVIQKNATVVTSNQSAYGTQFTPGIVNDHTGLSNLASGNAGHTQFGMLANANNWNDLNTYSKIKISGVDASGYDKIVLHNPNAGVDEKTYLINTSNDGNLTIDALNDSTEFPMAAFCYHMVRTGIFVTHDFHGAINAYTGIVNIGEVGTASILQSYNAAGTVQNYLTGLTNGQTYFNGDNSQKIAFGTTTSLTNLHTGGSKSFNARLVSGSVDSTATDDIVEFTATGSYRVMTTDIAQGTTTAERVIRLCNKSGTPLATPITITVQSGTLYGNASFSDGIVTLRCDGTNVYSSCSAQITTTTINGNFVNVWGTTLYNKTCTLTKDWGSKVVTMHIPPVTAAAASLSNMIEFYTGLGGSPVPIPTGYRPQNTSYKLETVFNNSAQTVGTVTIQTNGEFQINAGVGNLPFTASGNAGFEEMTFSWVTA